MDFSSITSTLEMINTPAGLTSLAYGAFFGAITTMWIFWSSSGHLKFPGFGTLAVRIALVSTVAVFFWNGIWTAILNFMIMLPLAAYIIREDFRDFVSLETLKKLVNNQAALKWGGMGLLAGGIIGAVSSQILAVPMQHCTFEDGVATRDRNIGLAVIFMSTIFLLIPLWTYMQRGRSLSIDNQSSSGYFKHGWVAILLLLPTLIILFVFLYYPAAQVVEGSMERASVRIGAEPTFVCLDNYNTLVESRLYAYENSLNITAKITAAVVLISMAISLFVANLGYQKIQGASIYRTFLIWPYAISPIVAGAIFLVMFNPKVGIINWALVESSQVGFIENLLIEVFGTTRPEWFSDPKLAIWVIIGASVWNILGFNILFYIAGLQSVPEDLLEAASIDGANSIQRFLFIKFPLLSPYTFFLLVTNVTYAFYGIFGVVDRLTQGGPPTPGNSRAGATDVLIYSLYETAFVGTRNKLGIANAQSLILFLLVAGITIIQFRVIEQRVTYGA